MLGPDPGPGTVLDLPRGPADAGTDWGRLADALVEVGYQELLGGLHPQLLVPTRWRSLRNQATFELQPVIDLFLLGERVRADRLPSSVRCQLPVLIRAGLLTEDPAEGEVLAGGLVLLWVSGTWLICDRPQPDPRFYLGEDSLALLPALIAVPGETCLDLCAGPGLHALHCARAGADVTAVERDPHACAVARVNARLNRVQDRVDVRSGDLYGPVAGRRFDLVVANPPSLPYPAELIGPTVGHGGPDGTAVVRRILAGLPDALADDGRAQLIGMTLGDARSGQLRSWLQEAADEHGLAIRGVVRSHVGLRVGTPFWDRLVGTIATISGTSTDRACTSYARLLARAGATHLDTFTLHVTRSPGAGAVELVDVGGSAEGVSRG